MRMRVMSICLSTDSVLPVLYVDQISIMDCTEECVACLAGFIVDKARGIICTNRHVVTPGMICRE